MLHRSANKYTNTYFSLLSSPTVGRGAQTYHNYDYFLVMLLHDYLSKRRKMTATPR